MKRDRHLLVKPKSRETTSHAERRNRALRLRALKRPTLPPKACCHSQTPPALRGDVTLSFPLCLQPRTEARRAAELQRLALGGAALCEISRCRFRVISPIINSGSLCQVPGRTKESRKRRSAPGVLVLSGFSRSFLCGESGLIIVTGL